MRRFGCFLDSHLGTAHYLWQGGRKNMRGAISIIGFTKGGLDEIHNQPGGTAITI